MSIDKESSGWPAVNVRRSATKVSLSMIAGIFLFLAVMAGPVLWMSRRPALANAEPAGASAGR